MEDADAWILNNQWTIITTINPPPRPTISTWIGTVQDRLSRAGAAVSDGHRKVLTARLNRLRFLHSESPVLSRRRRGLINFIGKAQNFLFGVATDSQVEAVHEQIGLASKRMEVLYNNEEKLVSVLNRTKLQSINNHEDILKLASTINDNMKKDTLLGWGIARLNVLHQFLHLVDQLDQLSLIILMRRRSYLSACEAMRSGHLSRDVMADDSLKNIVDMLSQRGYVMPLDWYRAYTPVYTVWDTEESLTCVFTLWSANKERLVLWTLRPLWFTDNQLVFRYHTRSPVITDRARSSQFVPAECRGHTHRICLVSQTDHDDCELTLIQGKTVTCTYDVAKIASPHLEYLSTDNWLVSVTECTNITARCPAAPASDYMVCQPERWNISSDCVIEWPYGKSVPISHQFLRVNPRYYAPLEWQDLQISPIRRESISNALEVHASLVVDPSEDIQLTKLPVSPGFTYLPGGWVSKAGLIIVIVLLIILLGVCFWRRWCCFSGRGRPRPRPEPTTAEFPLLPFLRGATSSPPMENVSSGPAVSLPSV